MKEFDVFISYSRSDSKKVNSFKSELEKECPDIKIWYDIDGIESGAEFEHKIISAINRSERVLFFVSRTSLSSRWTKKEVAYANNKHIPIIPVLLDKDAPANDDWLLFNIGTLNYVDLDNPQQRQKLISDLCEWHHHRPPAPAPPKNPQPAQKSKSILYLTVSKFCLIVFSLFTLCGVSFCVRVQGSWDLLYQFGVTESYAKGWADDFMFTTKVGVTILFLLTIFDKKKDILTACFCGSLLLTIPLLTVWYSVTSIIICLIVLGAFSALYASENIFFQLKSYKRNLSHKKWHLFILLLSLLYAIGAIITRSI